RASGTIASSTGSTRRRSSSGSTGSAPGRVDSPPTSILAAPSSIIRAARSTARSGARCSPPSENESGVTLSTPMTSPTVTSAAVEEAHGLGPAGYVGAEHPSDRGGDRGGARLADAPHRHAHVLGLDDHEHSAGVELLLDRVRDLGGEPLLHLGAPGVPVDQSGELRQPGDPAVGVRDVRDV